MLDKKSRKSKKFNQPSGKSGKLTKSGRIYANDLMTTDFTRQDMGTTRKLK